MYKDQITERALFRYPPNWNFIIIKLKNKDKNKLYNAARSLVFILKKVLHQRVLGPEEPLVNRISTYYLLNVHVRFEKNLSSGKIKELIVNSLNQIKQNPEFRSIRFEIDVDPI